MDIVKPDRRTLKVPAAIAAATAIALVCGAVLYQRAQARTNTVALAARPRSVSVVAAARSTYRDERRYVGTVQPWYTARIGPQLVSAYVDTVLVRPGASAKRGQVIATLDCRNASSVDQNIKMQARALEKTQAALADKASRMSTLLDGGFAAPDEVEMHRAESDSKQAQLLGLKAQMLGANLQVQDCVLRAPFDGEVAERFVDPGAFVRPGTALLTFIDRDLVRLTAEVPEADFAAVAPGTPVRIHLLANGNDLTGKIARRAPSADESTRTVHVEVDLPNREHTIPVGTTAEVRLDAGTPVQATVIPLAAASVRGHQATVVMVDGDVAHKRMLSVLGERGGDLFLDTALSPGALVVMEGREGLGEGEHVAPHRQGTEHAVTEADRAAPAASSGSGSGKTL